MSTDPGLPIGSLLALIADNVGGGVGGGDASAANQITGNASLAAIDTKLGTQAGYLDGLEGLVTAGNALLTTIRSPGLVASATFTPAGTSHVANNCNGAAGTFAFGAVSGTSIIINSASLLINGATAEATAWRAYLYSVTPPSAIADDGAWDLASGDQASFRGYIDIPTAVDLGSTQYYEVNGLAKEVDLAGTGLFGYLVNLTTLTPANVSHIVKLNAIQL